MDIISLDRVTFSYPGENAPVLRDLSLSVRQGSCLVIQGDNGAGKTTLLRILNGLSFPTAGRYLFDGEEITEKRLRDSRQSKRFHKRIGFLFQNPDIMLFNSSVYDEIAFGPRQMGLSDRDVDSRVQDCLRLFGLEALSDKAPYHLSGGQKKKVALAAVMALNPEVLTLDEPYAGLDGKSRDSLTAFLQDLKRAGKTLLIAAHEPAAEQLADEILTLE